MKTLMHTFHNRQVFNSWIQMYFDITSLGKKEKLDQGFFIFIIIMIIITIIF